MPHITTQQLATLQRIREKLNGELVNPNQLQHLGDQLETIIELIKAPSTRAQPPVEVELQMQPETPPADSDILTNQEIMGLDRLGGCLRLHPEEGVELGWASGFLKHIRRFPDQRDVLRAALRKVLQQTDNGHRNACSLIRIFLDGERNVDGWVEYGIYFSIPNNDRYIAVIQRTIDGEVEFHS